MLWIITNCVIGIESNKVKLQSSVSYIGLHKDI